MQIIDLSVVKQAISRKGDVALVAGEVGVHAVHVTYDEAWNSAASRVLCFTGPSGSVAVMDEGSETPVPWEVLKEPGMLNIGVIGYDNAGSVVITTRIQTPYESGIRIYPNTTCEEEATPPAEFSPSIWTQLLGSVGALPALKTANKNNLVAAINEVFAKTELKTDDTLILEDGLLRVNTANAAEQDNSLPITSAAVHTTVGNIETLLSTI